MSSYYIELTFELGKPDDQHGFEAHLDNVAEAFAELTDVDGDVGADLESGRIDLCMTLQSNNPGDAVTKAVTAARTAVHAAGGSTPGWEQMLSEMLASEQYQMKARLSDLANSSPVA